MRNSEQTLLWRPGCVLLQRSLALSGCAMQSLARPELVAAAGWSQLDAATCA
jgi:hypothetical protein